MYKQIIVLILLAGVINAQTTGWRNCGKFIIFTILRIFLFNYLINLIMYTGSYLGSIIRVRIEGCPQTPCTFRRGESYRLEADARSCEVNNNVANQIIINAYFSDASSRALPFTVTGTSLGIELPIHSGNACDYLTSGVCPVVSNAEFGFGITYEIPSWIPPVRILHS